MSQKVQVKVAGLPNGAINAETLEKKIMKDIINEIKSANMDGLNAFDLDIDAGLELALELA
ncbi:hypothetical protein KKE54_01195 [bacterium]|jgi:hypothetical protein|nr:hypothetical protein [bacterium]